MRRPHLWIVAGAALALVIGGGGCAPNESVMSDAPLQQGRAGGTVDPKLTAALGTLVDGREWKALADEFEMRHAVLKGDDALESPEHGVEVLSRRRVWRIILSVHSAPDAQRRPYTGPLPLGVRTDDGPADLIRRLGKPQSDEPGRLKDRWMVYRVNGMEYIFAFTNPPVLDLVMMQRVGD